MRLENQLLAAQQTINALTAQLGIADKKLTTLEDLIGEVRTRMHARGLSTSVAVRRPFPKTTALAHTDDTTNTQIPCEFQERPIKFILTYDSQPVSLEVKGLSQYHTASCTLPGLILDMFFSCCGSTIYINAIVPILSLPLLAPPLKLSKWPGEVAEPPPTHHAPSPQHWHPNALLPRRNPLPVLHGRSPNQRRWLGLTPGKGLSPRRRTFPLPDRKKIRKKYAPPCHLLPTPILTILKVAHIVHTIPSPSTFANPQQVYNPHPVYNSPGPSQLPLIYSANLDSSTHTNHPPHRWTHSQNWAPTHDTSPHPVPPGPLISSPQPPPYHTSQSHGSQVVVIDADDFSDGEEVELEAAEDFSGEKDESHAIQVRGPYVCKFSSHNFPVPSPSGRSSKPLASQRPTTPYSAATSPEHPPSLSTIHPTSSAHSADYRTACSTGTRSTSPDSPSVTFGLSDGSHPSGSCQSRHSQPDRNDPPNDHPDPTDRPMHILCPHQRSAPCQGCLVSME